MLVQYPKDIRAGFVFMLCSQVIGMHAVESMCVRMRVLFVVTIRKMKMHGKGLNTNHQQQHADDKTLASVFVKPQPQPPLY